MKKGCKCRYYAAFEQHRINDEVGAYALMRPGVNALRTPAYPAMISVVNNEKVLPWFYKRERQCKI